MKTTIFLPPAAEDAARRPLTAAERGRARLRNRC
jgi:hypothetical protein